MSGERRDGFMEEWEKKGFPRFTPAAPVWREVEDGRGNLRLVRANVPRGVLTVGEIAGWTGLCVQAIFQRLYVGEFDCGPFGVLRVGAAVRIPVETFAEWVERCWKKGR